jgi:hypothetical protein
VQGDRCYDSRISTDDIFGENLGKNLANFQLVKTWAKIRQILIGENLGKKSGKFLIPFNQVLSSLPFDPHTSMAQLVSNNSIQRKPFSQSPWRY